MKHYFIPDPEEQHRAELARALHPTTLELRRLVHATLQDLRDTASSLLRTPHSAIRTPRPRRQRRPPKK